MKLYLLSQDDREGYDTYDSCVVAANSEEEAVLINPDGANRWNSAYSAWATSPDKVTCQEIGTAKRGTKPGVIIASFNAG